MCEQSRNTRGMRVTRLNVMESASIPHGIGSHTPQPRGVNACGVVKCCQRTSDITLPRTSLVMRSMRVMVSVRR